MAGGASIVCFIVITLFVDKGADMSRFALAVYYIAFLVNYPHFMSSYLLLYSDARHGWGDWKSNRIFALKLWWAGVIVPVFLVAIFVYGLVAEDREFVGSLANIMYFFVGWHYIKQIYGCVIVLSSAKKVYYSALERWSILIPLYSLWAIAYVNANMSGGIGRYFQVAYQEWNIPEGYLYGAYAMLAMSTYVMVAMLVKKYVTEQKGPPIAAIVALISIYLWFIPTFTHPFYAYIIPFFHSLQYLLFVIAYERNHEYASAALPTTSRFNKLTGLGGALFLALPLAAFCLLMYVSPPQSADYLLVLVYGTLAAVSTLLWVKTALVLAVALAIVWYIKRRAKNAGAMWRFVDFFVTAFVLGVLFFQLVPTIFDILVRNHLLPAYLDYQYSMFGVSLYLYFFTVLINVHHYFIDNVIWKSDNPHIRAHLFAPKV